MGIMYGDKLVIELDKTFGYIEPNTYQYMNKKINKNLYYLFYKQNNRFYIFEKVIISNKHYFDLRRII